MRGIRPRAHQIHLEGYREKRAGWRWDRRRRIAHGADRGRGTGVCVAQ